jgi:SAM-dependent methyltransferase
MPTEQAQRHYRGEAGRRYQQTKRALPEQAIPWVAALRARKFASLVGVDDVVLEYGVGSGWNLAGLRCARRLGFDVADFLEAPLRELGIEFLADTKVIPEASLDVVICHHTLEHVLHPPEVLEEVRRLLKPAGRLLLHVPFEIEGRYEHFHSDEPNHHLYSWNAQTLGNLVEEAGFKVAEAGIGEFGYDRFAANWAVRLNLGETGFRWLRRAAHLIRPAFEVRIRAVKTNVN